MKVLLLILGVFLLTPGVPAQTEPVKSDWLDSDIKYIREGSELLRQKKPPLDDVRRQLEIKYLIGDKEISFLDGNDFGFGFKRFNYRRGGGYCYFYASGFALNNDYALYRIGVDCGSEYWKRIRTPIIKAWKEAGGPAFQEDRGGIFAETSYNDVVERYKAQVSRALGPMKPVEVPAKLQKYYDYLIDPLENSIVGIGGCDYGGVTPDGKDSIDLFIEAKRVDLLENILRGYNPGGRLYAAMALIRMEKDGIKLDAETRSTIEKVANLDIDIEICRGCIHSYHTGKDILKLLSL